jgi:hypothetical protein
MTTTVVLLYFQENLVQRQESKDRRVEGGSLV